MFFVLQRLPGKICGISDLVHEVIRSSRMTEGFRVTRPSLLRRLNYSIFNALLLVMFIQSLCSVFAFVFDSLYKLASVVGAAVVEEVPPR